MGLGLSLELGSMPMPPISPRNSSHGTFIRHDKLSLDHMGAMNAQDTRDESVRLVWKRVERHVRM